MLNPNSEMLIEKDKTFEIIKSAVNKMVDMIRPTFGPANNKVIIDKQMYKMAVDDGVQIARDFELSDPKENAIATLIRETAIRTNDRVGDGTTGALIMLQAIINEVARRSKFEGRKIELELKKGLEEVKEHIKKTSTKIETIEDLRKVALISFDDKKIADMLADAYYKLGKDGVITIDKSSTMETTIEITDGVKINSGYISQYMITNPERMEAVIEKPYFLITDYRMTEAADIISIMNKMSAAGKTTLIVIADNIEQSALATMVVNLPNVINPHTRKPGQFMSIGIVAPKVSDRKTFLEDIAMLTGARLFSQAKGDKLEDVEMTDLGQAKRFICKQDESIIVEPKDQKKMNVQKSIASLKLAIKYEKDINKKEDVQKRLGLLTNTLAVVKVGAPTDNEQKSLKYKVEDVVHSIKSAFRNGVVCGSGLSLFGIKTSSSILNEALKYPARQLRENMGMSVDIEYKKGEALNVVTGKIGKFIDVGVVDPADVLIAGVESAVSIASLLLTSSGMLVEAQKKKNEK